ncbi:hypothetical protein M0813_05296 [Anaeramoeba flamelloides]|uniref:Uncharacterized protein n=1 Tax=Anaeramoeba flamelloides TaxID=1746091 RepID=A0ABQ8XIL5_9EUKA|nr:hypothetical protein M0813_05296 [Anaeramoeba flamelloides]
MKFYADGNNIETISTQGSSHLEDIILTSNFDLGGDFPDLLNSNYLRLVDFSNTEITGGIPEEWGFSSRLSIVNLTNIDYESMYLPSWIEKDFYNWFTTSSDSHMLCPKLQGQIENCYPSPNLDNPQEILNCAILNNNQTCNLKIPSTIPITENNEQYEFGCKNGYSGRLCSECYHNSSSTYYSVVQDTDITAKSSPSNESAEHTESSIRFTSVRFQIASVGFSSLQLQSPDQVSSRSKHGNLFKI